MARNINLESLAAFVATTGEVGQVQVLLEAAAKQLEPVYGEVDSVPALPIPELTSNLTTNFRSFMTWVESVEVNSDSINKQDKSVMSLAALHNLCLTRTKRKGAKPVVEAKTEDDGKTASEILSEEDAAKPITEGEQSEQTEQSV